MAENLDKVLTCANCGHSFNASSGSSKFKCSQCEHPLQGVTDTGKIRTGKVICGDCWADIELREEILRASQSLMGMKNNAQAETRPPSDPDAELIEWKTRHRMAADETSAVLRERDIAIEARHKIEKTLAEFLEKFAVLREAEASVRKERDEALQGKKAAAQKMEEMKADLMLTLQTRTAALAERNTAVQARDELEAKLDMLEAQLQAQHAQIGAQQRPSLDEKVAALEHQITHLRETNKQAIRHRDRARESVKELETRVAGLEASMSEGRAQAAETQHQLDARIAELHAELVAGQFDLFSAGAERDMARTAQHEAEAKLEDLEERLAQAQETQMTALKERDEAVLRADREQQNVIAARNELTHFRDVAIATLEPLGGDCNQKMKDLVAQTESMMSQSLEARRQAQQRAEALEALITQLKDNIASTRRNITGRISLVLGQPANESQMQRAIKVSSSAEQRAIAG